MKKRYLLLILLLGLVPETLKAEVITVYQSTETPTTTENINTEFALNTVTKTGTYDNNGAYQEIYAAYKRVSGGAGSSAWGVQQTSGAGCRIRLNATDLGQAGQTLHMFKTGGISFNAGNDTITTKLTVSDWTRLATAELRIVIEEAGQFYISAPSANYGAFAGQYYAPTINALSVDWFSYDPSTVDGISTVGAAAAPTFADIGFVGFNLLAEGDAAGDGGGVNFGVREFTVSNIPEPATLGLLGLSSMGIILMRRCMLI